MKLPIEVVEAVKAQKCILFLGSHAAAEAADLKNLSWSEAGELAKELGWRKPKAIVGMKAKAVVPSVFEGAAMYEAAHGRAALVKLLKERLDTTKAEPTEAHRGALRHFPIVFTTGLDDLVERAAKDTGVALDVIERGQKIPDPDKTRRTLVRLHGGLDRPDTAMLTTADFKAKAFSPDLRKQLRSMIRGYVVLFVGYRPDEEEFEHLFGELSDAYGGELPRCHMAVAQGNIDDYQWQKWVWRGLLMFLSDPADVITELEASLR